MERERETERQRQRQKERDRDSDRKTETERDIQTAIYFKYSLFLTDFLIYNNYSIWHGSLTYINNKKTKNIQYILCIH